MNSYKRGIMLCALGTLFFSTSPIFTRWAQALPVGEITFFRMLFASIFILIAAKWAKVDLKLDSQDVPKFLIYGFITNLHFLFYIGSVIYTSVAHSLSLVYTSPIMIAVLSAIFLREPIPKYKYFGIFMVILGIIILAGFEPVITKRMLLGDIMALASALCLALYSLAGRRERNNFPLLKYVFWVYSLAAVFLLPLAIKDFIMPSGIKEWSALILMSLLPMTLGHTMYNAGLRYVHPTYANLISTQEVTVGVLLGYFLLDEVPSKNSIIGIIIMLAGLFAVLSEINIKRNSDKRKEKLERHRI